MPKKVNLKPGDRVMKNNKYHIPESDKGVVFTVMTTPWEVCGTKVVKLQGKSGSYAVDGLDIVPESDN